MASIRIKSEPQRQCGTVERAFQIARSGDCGGMIEIVRILKDERFDRVDEHLAGQSIRRDLRRAWEEAGPAEASAPLGQAEEHGR